MPVIANISLSDELVYVSTRLPRRLLSIVDQLAAHDLKTRSATLRDFITKSIEDGGLVRRPQGPVVLK